MLFDERNDLNSHYSKIYNFKEIIGDLDSFSYVKFKQPNKTLPS
jgi:thiamine pyrophosphokinase